jgi:hypothetical protein
MILSSCISITLHVEHDTDDELVINDDVALAEMENTIEKKKKQMAMIGPKQRWKNSLKKHILMVLMRLEWRWKRTLCIMNTTFHFLYEKKF